MIAKKCSVRTPTLIILRVMTPHMGQEFPDHPLLEQDEKPNGVAKPAPRQPPQARVVPPTPKKPQNDYLGDIDLPSSSSEDEGPEEKYTPIYAADDGEKELKSMVGCKAVFTC